MKVKLRHRIVFAILRPIFYVYFKLFYNYKYDKFKGEKGESYIMLSNHVTTLDPFFMSVMVNFPVYFVASDQLLNLGLISRIMKFLVSPIPKTKGMSDLQTVKDIVSVTKQNGSVGIFPEGNRTFTGETCYIPPQIAKLIKLSKKTVLFFNLKGGFFSKPRFAAHIRRGKMEGRLVKVWRYEEYKDLSSEEIFEEVRKNLFFNAYEDERYRFKGRKRAEYLEHPLYVCPDCKGIATMKSKGNYYTCSTCGAQVFYEETGDLTCKSGSIPFTRIDKWYEWQNEYLVSIKPQEIEGVILQSSPVKLYDSAKGKDRKKIGDGKMELYNNRLTFETENGKVEISFEDIAECVVQTLGKMQIYLKDGRILVAIAKRNESVLKYVVLIHIIKNSMEGRSNEFLGL